ncbi:MAG TPA: hypothetical protein VH833_07095 [Gemmatimonadales bacterium]
MANRAFKLSMIVLVAGVGLALVQPRGRATDDLDSYTDEQLQRDLTDELDDIYAQADADGEYDLDVLRTAILDALGDAGDEGYEDEIDLADLNQEMEEAGTTLEDVVDEALARADELALRKRSSSWTIVQAGFSGNSFHAQGHDRRAKSKVATDQTVRGLRAAIRAK